jgi:hypothetical protein
LREPLFDSFPYLLTRVVSQLRHYMLLPSDVSEDQLERFTRIQGEMNLLDTALVLDEETAFYCHADGYRGYSSIVPRGGYPVAGKLQPAVAFAETDEMKARWAELRAFVSKHSPDGGYLVGTSKGGRRATELELAELSGFQEGRVPLGLERCEICGEWRGECLDPHPSLREWLTPVHCRCDNHNDCAACGHTLADRRLNANFFNVERGQIWHVPGFAGLSHRCPPGSELLGTH